MCSILIMGASITVRVKVESSESASRDCEGRQVELILYLYPVLRRVFTAIGLVSDWRTPGMSKATCTEACAHKTERFVDRKVEATG